MATEPVYVENVCQYSSNCGLIHRNTTNTTTTNNTSYITNTNNTNRNNNICNNNIYNNNNTLKIDDKTTKQTVSAYRGNWNYNTH